ncbi:MAG TPA: ABC transporter substrate-binding protein [Mycobacteriales bacterium]|nr:ABC transporter substrate-binding protein [Mycobacteriales bacterium]
MKPRQAAAACGLALAALAGCGTTVDLPPGSSAQAVPDSGLGGPTGLPSPHGGTSGTSGGQGVATDGTGSPGGPSAPVGTSPAGITAPGPHPARPAPSTPSGVRPSTAQSGNGFTATTITLGFPYADVSSFASALGLKGLDSGDPLAEATAVVNDINKHGGILGRQVKLVTFKGSAVQALTSPSSEDQAACAHFTQDNHVFAVMYPDAAIYGEQLLGCLAQASTPLVVAGGIDAEPFGRSVFEKFPTFFDIGDMTYELYDQIAYSRLAARGFFTGWNTTLGGPGKAPVKVGLLGIDDTWGTARIKDQERQLAAHGITTTAVVQCPSNVTETINCQQSAELKFRSLGVTHVFGAGVPFISTANNQHYYPRYFVTVEPALFAQNAPPKTLVGAMSESFIPAMDVDAAQSPGPPTGATTRCVKTMRAANLQTTYGTELWAEEATCDAFYFTAAALDKSQDLSPNGLRAGFEALGSTQPSALTWTTRLDATHHTSAAALRDLSFQVKCDCFAYTSRTNYR